MMLIYIILSIFISIVFLVIALKEAKKWDWVMIGMIVIPLFLRIFLIK